MLFYIYYYSDIRPLTDVPPSDQQDEDLDLSRKRRISKLTASE